MATWSPQDALKLIDEMDQCVVDLLPVNLSSSLTASNAEASAERFLSTVTTLKASLQSLLENTAVEQEKTPQQELEHLRRELAVKDQLIVDAEEKVAQWQKKCAVLLAKHEDNTRLR